MVKHGRTAIVVALALALALPSAAAAVKVRRSADATGVGVNGLVDSRGVLRPIAGEHVKLMADDGIKAGRTDAYWSWAELGAPKDPSHHVYSWWHTDNIAMQLAKDGIRWWPILDYSTGWSTTVPGNQHAPPASDADYAAYARAFAARYGSGGSFWSSHRDLPYLPVTSYEIWNEENAGFFWAPVPDPARYAGLYLAARNAIHASDPHGRVLVGGLTAAAKDYVRGMYSARPDLRGHVDGIAYHPYAASAELSLRLVRELRGVVDGLGEDSVPLYVTEVGWPTAGSGDMSAPPLPDATRAGNLSLLTDGLLGSNCDVGAILPYTWATAEKDPEYDSQWLGIFNPDTTATEAGLAYVAAIDRNASVAGKSELALDLCRDRGTSFADPLKLSVSIATASGRNCYAAKVSYRGRPLNGVTVDFVDRRSHSSHGSHAESDDNGKATICLHGGGSRTLEASAKVLGVARSKTAKRHVG